ncbi:beta-ketoacyl-[acyl-carrier-protein] synthase family protein [Streptomyces albidoflavus]|uniref:3-ketoacyl-ACP synthase n=2 Tax=Streptomyces TaxID=1883 RepID=Q2MGD1_STRGR|nr:MULTISPECIES: beta-ketoacyl-[acyl-carrier-protein] synthase family protein [Streptomyces]AAQ08916.1 3-ketoacyl-ACP synthase [Streptomyces griseus]MYX50879.1 beta-ketoacyl-ACP synthase II [Streptomyces sp. SID8385]SCD84982.1 act minimal PKS ketosynthase (KS/KS alpha) [Streptomyces sp. IgraMP-1]MBT2876918.1 beta-ketoacyl-[acyl-carrier-protein] synthase family protein [Streptomyces sp. McG6]MBT2884060.1 beta-ketoacyl-[acyl-carrier-protein] synthase family protein [Streptomyces sp. McG5]
MTARAVITGIGVVAPGRPGRENFWEMIVKGQTATRRITLFDPAPFRSRIGAECDFDPERNGLSYQEMARTDRAGQFAIVAAREAVADSGMDLGAENAHRVGVSVGNGVGNAISMEQAYRTVSDNGRRWLVDQEYAGPHLYSSVMSSSLAAEVAWATGAEGPATVVSSGCCAGIDAVGYAVDLIREGSAEVMVAGATDAPIYPITVSCFDTLRASSTSNDDPEHACRPFDRRRNGLVLGEGSAVFVVEELEHARRRGARIYCEVAGYSARANGYHMTGLRPDGREMGEAITAALDEARINPDEVDYANAHGSGTKQNDRHETAAYKRSLGEHAYRIPVSSIKSMVGHSLGSIGSIEIAASALAIDRGTVPPTANYEERDPECDLDYVPGTAREAELDVVLSVGSGFGGFQSAVVLTSPRRIA